MIRYIILNGPPEAGKTTISTELVRAMRHECGDPGLVAIDSFAAPIKHFIAAALAEQYHKMNKSLPRPELSGRSVREALIALAEDHCKVVYGDDIFGKWLVHRSLKHPQKKPAYVIVDDGGFPAEVLAVPNRFVVRVTRDNKTFTGDSRGYIEGPDWVLNNSGTMADTWIAVGQLAKHLVGNGR